MKSRSPRCTHEEAQKMIDKIMHDVVELVAYGVEPPHQCPLYDAGICPQKECNQGGQD